MDNDDDELHQPSTSSVELSGKKTSECQKQSSRLNNNIEIGYNDSECCADCDTAAQHDHMIAASLVYCDQEDNNDSDDDCCIYTYRGDRQEQGMVDILPTDNRSASPLMDYLEMDFDPEPIIGIESDGEDITPAITNNHKSEPLVNVEISKPSCSIIDSNKQEVQTIVENGGINRAKEPIIEMSPINLNLPCASQNGYTNSKEERSNGCLRRNADTTEVCHKMKRMRVHDLNWVKEMVWSESDAAQLQISQIDVSACGATAVINTLLALRIPFSIDRITKTIGTRLRDETAPLISYLESRGMAGCMPQDLVRTLETATDSPVSARFFATRQNLELPIAPWLAGWIKKGAVPILTLNLQCVPSQSHIVPDSWHHQMIYGVEYNPLYPECAQIYLTNPLSQSSMEVLRPQLIAPSTLMIKRADVLSRWTPQTDLMSLATHPSQYWHKYNVLGQIVNLLREEKEDVQFTNHIVIPANYKSGITLAIRKTSIYSHELKSVAEL